MKYRVIPVLVFILLYILNSGGCASGKVELQSQESRNWAPVIIESIPQLRAVEVPLEISMASESLREQMDARQRIRLTDEVVIAFESWSPIGLLNRERSQNIRYEDARQFAAYCTNNNKISLVYNFVDTRPKSCRYLSEKWKSDIVMDSECTSLGVFESKITCQTSK